METIEEGGCRRLLLGNVLVAGMAAVALPLSFGLSSGLLIVATAGTLTALCEC